MNKLRRIGEASAEAGLTVKQLRHLEELGLVQPRSVGSHRGYGDTELAVLAALKGLMDRDPRFTPKFIQKVLSLEGFPVGEVPELRRLVELRREASRVVPETERYQTVLKDALHGEKQLIVGDFQSYNSSYKRLRRLAGQMGLLLELRKKGQRLHIRTRHQRPLDRPRHPSTGPKRRPRS